MSQYPVRLMLDSGAYSCWRKGETIDVDRYADFIEEYRPYIHQVVNLDVIPGEWGRVPSNKEVQRSAEAGVKNLLRLKERGIKAMPVFHQGETLEWLQLMLDEGFDYIGISPANDRTTKQKRAWLDEIFEYLCGGKDYPTVKTHAFGVTALDLVARYPWFSYDSITWVLVAAYGSIMVPSRNLDGSPSWRTSPHIVNFSDSPRKRPENLTTAIKHWTQFGPAFQSYVKDFVESTGHRVEDLAGHYKVRQAVNAKFFMRVEQEGKTEPFRRSSTAFFTRHKTSYGTDDNWIVKARKIFTCSTAAEHSRILTRFQQRDRLISYFYFKDAYPFDLAEYVQAGEIPLKRDKKPKPKIERVKLLG